jgi:hypothetical protein
MGRLAGAEVARERIPTQIRKSAMDEPRETVGPLKKIRVLLEPGTGPDPWEFTAEPIPFEFIYGTGIQGLSPFELQLADLKEGDSLSMTVRGDELSDLFQHLLLPPFAMPEGVGAFYLEVKIVKVSEADPKEVIKAMAEGAACGDHCCGH